MEINIENLEEIQVVKLIGDMDASTSPQVQQEILPLTQPKSKILLDMSQVAYMSSAGLRVLLMLYRQATAQDGKLILVGLSEDIRDTMSVTGFLDFFTAADTTEAGLTELQSETLSIEH